MVISEFESKEHEILTGVIARIDPSTGKDVYKRQGVCDICGDKLVIRSDDQPEVVKRRHETYHEQTEPLVDYYEKQGKLTRIDGTQGIRETEKLAVEALEL